MTSRQEIFLPANRPETDRITVSPLVTEIIQESSLHPDCGKNSPVKNRLESTGNLPTLLEVWGQSLQQIDDQLRTLTEEGTVRFNYHSVREIKEKVNNNFVQKGDNQEGQDDFLPEGPWSIPSGQAISGRSDRRHSVAMFPMVGRSTH